MAYRVGRYEVHDPVASGGMAVVHLGRIVGPVGFSRTVAIKRLHPHLATDPEFVTMFLDEARLAARVQHPNVVATLDIVASHGQLFLVMDFVLGASLSQLVRESRQRGLEPPHAIVSSVVAGALYGLHAAHEARDEHGRSLGIVHRDVSPQNLLVGIDGVTRVVDFGVAKAAARRQSTREGQIKGKLAYMAPEQILRKTVDRRADIYSAGVILWEALTLKRLFTGDHEGAVIAAVLEGEVRPPSELRRGLPPSVDAVVARALSPDPGARFPTAQDFAAALEAAVPVAPQREVGAWVERIGGADVDRRRGLVSAVEQSPRIERDSEDAAVEGLVGHTLSSEEARRLATALTSTLPSRAAPGEGEDIEIPTAPRHGARRVRLGGAIALAAITGAIVASAMSFPRRAWPGSAAAPAPCGTPSSGVAPPASVGPPPSIPPAASTGIVPAPTTAHVAPARPAGAPRPHALAASAHRDGASCDPPFVLDMSGIKRFKPWCI